MPYFAGSYMIVSSVSVSCVAGSRGSTFFLFYYFEGFCALLRYCFSTLSIFSYNRLGLKPRSRQSFPWSLAGFFMWSVRAQSADLSMSASVEELDNWGSCSFLDAFEKDLHMNSMVIW